MASTFHSLRWPNFRLWVVGNLFAATGMWMQRVAQDWLVLTELSDNSGVQVGIVTALQFLPLLLLSPWAGVLADRLDRRRLIQATQSIMALCAVILGVLLLTGTVNLWAVYVLALVGGIASAIDNPARQTFVSELVPADSLSNAVSLNSVAFNISRLVGPACAGLVIDQVGTGWVFLINAALFATPILTLMLIREEELCARERVARARGQIREGVNFVRSRPDVALIMVVMTIVSCLGLNFQLTSALMATEVYGRAAGEYGLLGSAMAIGGLAGSLLSARRARPRLRFVLGAAGLFGLCEAALALAPSYLAFAALSVPLGLFTMTMITSANALVQISTPESYRGRVMALYGMIFLGTTPVGAPLVGWVGEAFGARWSLLVGAIASVLVSVVATAWGLHVRGWQRPGRLNPDDPTASPGRQ